VFALGVALLVDPHLGEEKIKKEKNSMFALLVDPHLGAQWQAARGQGHGGPSLVTRQTDALQRPEHATSHRSARHLCCGAANPHAGRWQPRTPDKPYNRVRISYSACRIGQLCPIGFSIQDKTCYHSERCACCSRMAGATVQVASSRGKCRLAPPSC
jgi:hypothetical protein